MIDFKSDTDIGGVNFTPDGPEKPDGYLLNLWHKATTENLDKASPYDPLAQFARFGQMGQRGNEQLADISAEKLGQAGLPPALAAIPGTVLYTASKMNPLLPTNRLSAALSLAGPLVGGVKKIAGAMSGAGEAVDLAGAGVGRPVQTIPEKMRAGLSTVSRSLLGEKAFPNSPSLPKNITENPYFVKTSDEAEKMTSAAASLKGESATPAFADKLYREMHDSVHEAVANLKSGKMTQDQASRVADAFQKLSAKKNLDTNPEEWIKIFGNTTIKQSEPGTLANLIVARAGRANGQITPRVAQYALDNPKVLDEAPTIEDATKKYVEAIPGLKGKVDALSERLNKTIIRPGDYDAAIDRVGRIVRGTPLKDEPGALDPQEALVGLQSINKAMRDKMYTSSLPKDQVAKVMALKDELLNYLENNGGSGIKEASLDLFRAHVRDAFKDWFPRNKYGSPDALRTTLAMSDVAKGLGVAGAGVVGGLPGAAVAGGAMAANAALSSPRVAGQLIREVGALRNPAVLQRASLLKTPLANALGTSEDKQ